MSAGTRSTPRRRGRIDDLGDSVGPVDITIGLTGAGLIHLALTSAETTAGVMVDLSPDEAREIADAILRNVETAEIIAKHGGQLSEGGRA